MAAICPITGAGASAPGKIDEISSLPSRRAIFGSLALAGGVAMIVAAAPAADAAERRFDRLIAQVERTEAALNATTADIDDAAYERMALDYGLARDAALDAPAPTWRQFVWKLEQAWHDEDDPTGEVKALILRDARLLAGLAA